MANAADIAGMSRHGGSPVQHPRAGLAAVLLLGLALSGCASFGGDKDVAVPLPGAAPKTLGIEAPVSAEHKRLVALFGGEYKWRPAQMHLNAILARLARSSETPSQLYRVTILNTPVVNAFALPSGNIYVTRGLLALANDSSEVAAVMAHEIAHVAARHAAQRAELEKREAVISKVATVIQNQERGQSIRSNSQRTLASFSRQQELDADEIGVKVIAAAGYDPYAASRFLAQLGRSTGLRNALIGQQGSTARPDIMSTHPSTPERVAQAIAAARQISAPGIGEQGRIDYLTAVDGMTFGDDPSQGSIRGRQFVHPRLGFGFTAPEGFVLDNSAQAVLGVAGGGSEALRLDSVHLASATTLEAYLASGWIDGLQQSSIASAIGNGLPMASAVAKGGEWSFRLAAIRLGTDVYRMIFATKDLSPEADARYRAAIDSFHRISTGEAQNVKPLKLAISAAQSGDTIESLAARMTAPDRPVDYFLLLNGLEAGGAVKAGEKYKLVVE